MGRQRRPTNDRGGVMSTELQGLIQAGIDGLVSAGSEVGVQVAAYVDGELVLDACAGLADRDACRPITPDTPFFAYSVGKGVAATVVHVLAERVVLDYDLPIADVWPEFAAHGKAAI